MVYYVNVSITSIRAITAFLKTVLEVSFIEYRTITRSTSFYFPDLLQETFYNTISMIYIK